MSKIAILVEKFYEDLELQYPRLRLKEAGHSVEIIGPKVSGELARAGILAVVFASLAMLAYIWVRFEWQFAVGAIATLVLDEVQVTYGLMYCVLPSVYTPMAEYCSDEAGASNALVGVRLIELSVAVLTVSAAVPVALAPP